MLHLVRSRLSVRLALLFLVASLLPVLGVGYRTLGQLEDSVHRDAERRQWLLASIVETLVGESVAQAEEKLTTVARLLARELEESGVGAFHAANDLYRVASVDRLSGLVEPPDVFLELQYFTRGTDDADDPQLVAQAQQVLVAQRQLAFPNNRNAGNINSNAAGPIVNDPLTLGTPHRDKSLSIHEGFPTLQVSQPIEEPAGTTGALVAYVDFSDSVATLERLAGESVGIRVLDDAGTVLANLGGSAEERLTHTSPLGSAGWIVEVSESQAVVREPLARLRRQIVPWILGAVLFAVAASLLFATRITRPVARLRKAAERLEQGDLSARAGVERPDEIGQLGAAFDRMATALHQLDEAKSEFVGNVSHELRTPLTSLRLTVANLLDGVTGELSEGQRDALERVRRELERLSTLVDDLLLLARLEAGVEPRRESVDLAALAAECAEALRPAAEAKQVTVSVSGAGAADADAGMLRRVLLNLVDNAVKFTPSGSRVRVRVAERRFVVEDDGPGGVTEEAFERFRQGEQDGVKHAGAGLGLAIARQLVHLHGGTLRASSNDGAVFTVELRGPEAHA